jgi:hypothetical protein
MSYPQPKRGSFTEEDTTLTRKDIQDFLNLDREDKGPNKGKTKIKPEQVRSWLKTKGKNKDAIDKVIGDLDSYL